MNPYSRSHLSDGTLLSSLKERVGAENKSSAEMLADLAEVDERRLYLPAGFPSMFAYCVEELRFSEDVAYKRIQAARAARESRSIFSRVADGRLHLSAVCLLAPHLTAENAEELFEAATHQSKAKIELLLANRFPKPDVLTMVRALPAPRLDQPASGQVVRAPHTLQPAPGQVQPTALNPPRVTPLAPKRYALQLTMNQEMHDDLRKAQELLSHAIPSGDVTQVLHRALRALIAVQERRKFGALTKLRVAIAGRE